MTAPRYQDIAGADIPEVTDDDGTHVRVITGEFWGKRGPVDGIAADPQYLDVTVPAGVRKTFRIDTYRRAFAYVFQGAGAFADASAPQGVLLEKEVMGREVNIRDLSGDRTLIRFGTGDEVTVQAGPAGVKKTFRIDTYRRAFAYVFQGAGVFADASAPQGVLLEKEVLGQEVNIRDMSGDRTLIRFGTGDEVTVQAGPEGVRFLLISGAPIEEPVAWHGPIVMNTQAELQQAMRDLRNGTFIKPAH
jgi:redox-sensitive bicupin YhaK (pirin superfamily)